MIILDSLLLGGIRFVLSQIARVVDAELNDENAVREELLAAQMRVETGEMSEEEFVPLERALLARLREIRERTPGAGSGDTKITGVEARAWDDEE